MQGRRFCLLPQSPALWHPGSACPRLGETCGARREIISGGCRVKAGAGRGSFPEAGGLVVLTSGSMRIGGRGLRSVAGTQIPVASCGHFTTVRKGRSAAVQHARTLLRALNPAPLVPAASPWRRAAKCGCAGVTERGRGGGGVLVLAARRPF